MASILYGLNEEETAHALGAAATSPPQANPEGFRELVAIDPDGNKIRLFSWAPGHHT